MVFPERAHDLEALDRGVGRPERLEAPDRPDELLQLAVVGLNDIVQLLGLPVDGVLRALALRLQLGQRRGVGGRLVRVDDRWLVPVL